MTICFRKGIQGFLKPVFHVASRPSKQNHERQSHCAPENTYTDTVAYALGLHRVVTTLSTAHMTMRTFTGRHMELLEKREMTHDACNSMIFLLCLCPCRMKTWSVNALEGSPYS